MTNIVMKDFIHASCRSNSSGLIYKNKTKAANESSLQAVTNKIKNVYDSASTNTPMSTNVYQNIPTAYIEIVQNSVHVMFMGYMHWQLKDPRGFSVYVHSNVIGYILENCTVINGVIQEELLYHIPYKYTDLEVLINKNGEWLNRSKKQWII